MTFHLTNADFVLTFAFALLGALATALRKPPAYGLPGIALRALLANLAALAAVLGLEIAPRLFA